MAVWCPGSGAGQGVVVEAVEIVRSAENVLGRAKMI